MARERSSGGVPTWVLVLAGLVFLGGVAVSLARAQRLPEGPVEVIWDKTVCAHCRMAVSERGFASQLQLQDGRVMDFDDPGCLFHALEGLRGQPVHAVWFHHLREDRWLAGAEAGFIHVEPTPMGYGLGAVATGTPGALSMEAARKAVVSPQEARR